MEEALIGKLLATSGLMALVGTRVYPGSCRKAAALPAIVFNMISSNPSYSDDGEDGIAEARVQLDCWGETYTDAKTVGARRESGAVGVRGHRGGRQLPLHHARSRTRHARGRQGATPNIRFVPLSISSSSSTTER